ncbi:Hypothetical predicted protein [Octopus vulgaris]|uniref:Uncharacterized protein n=1 Tax=Octopus vulgaris TaxID=6645 RepID=A0AA36AT13_OCTVU|nr:Hypothetical predicted protein [Octopus vulgaris]
MEAREHYKVFSASTRSIWMDNGIMKPKWTEGELMPCLLMDILEELEDETCVSDSDPDSDNEFSESDFLARVISWVRFQAVAGIVVVVGGGGSACLVPIVIVVGGVDVGGVVGSGIHIDSYHAGIVVVAVSST